MRTSRDLFASCAVISQTETTNCMKKKTVITTETREVWVIHRPLDSSQESGQETNGEGDPPGDNRSLAVPAERLQPEDASLENE